MKVKVPITDIQQVEVKAISYYKKKACLLDNDLECICEIDSDQAMPNIDDDTKGFIVDISDGKILNWTDLNTEIIQELINETL